MWNQFPWGLSPLQQLLMRQGEERRRQLNQPAARSSASQSASFDKSSSDLTPDQRVEAYWRFDKSQKGTWPGKYPTQVDELPDSLADLPDWTDHDIQQLDNKIYYELFGSRHSSLAPAMIQIEKMERRKQQRLAAANASMSVRPEAADEFNYASNEVSVETSESKNEQEHDEEWEKGCIELADSAKYTHWKMMWFLKQEERCGQELEELRVAREKLVQVKC